MNTRHLTEQLHDWFLSMGQVASNQDLATWIQEYEFSNDCEFTESELIKAIRDAGESFVDSMQTNETDTWEEHCRDLASPNPSKYPRYESEEEYQRCQDKWEAMRPSVIRRKSIASIIVSDSSRPWYPRITAEIESREASISAEIDACEAWHEENGSLHSQVG